MSTFSKDQAAPYRHSKSLRKYIEPKWSNWQLQSCRCLPSESISILWFIFASSIGIVSFVLEAPCRGHSRPAARSPELPPRQRILPHRRTNGCPLARAGSSIRPPYGHDPRSGCGIRMSDVRQTVDVTPAALRTATGTQDRPEPRRVGPARTTSRSSCRTRHGGSTVCRGCW